MTLPHGGELNPLINKYQIDESDWLDLSTGIAPISYPIPQLDISVWQKLPQINPSTLESARNYYGYKPLVMTSGSQEVIARLPYLYQPPSKQDVIVHLPERGYKEHAYAWQQAGFQLKYYQRGLPSLDTLTPSSVLVVINPNNPTGEFFTPDELSQYQQKLAQLNGLLVVDEAFIDTFDTSQSLCSKPLFQNTLILRSFGKFFGLAGIRIGFLIASQQWCERFLSRQSPWQVNGPAQAIAAKALTDVNWHQSQRRRLALLKKMLLTTLAKALPSSCIKSIGGTSLFQSIQFHQGVIATKLHHLLCLQGIYCRLCDEQDALRFGLPMEHQLQRLDIALHNAVKQLGLSD
ncbi:threonine-phosphate decarboxylase CobD [Thalassotalea ganghwensis]